MLRYGLVIFGMFYTYDKGLTVLTIALMFILSAFVVEESGLFSKIDEINLKGE